MPTFTQPKRVLANNLGEIQMLDKFIQTKVSITWFGTRSALSTQSDTDSLMTTGKQYFKFKRIKHVLFYKFTEF